jgi:GT2 family glycosyltransferase
MEKDSGIGAVACKVRYMAADGLPGDRLDSAGGQLDLFGFPCIRGNRQLDRGQYDQPGETFFAFGCSILVRRDLFEMVGGYDHRLFTLADDIDLCWRMRLMGYRIYYEPRALLFHRGSATIGSAFKRSQTRYMSERHTLRMLLKNYCTLSLGWVLPACGLILLAEIWFYLSSGNWLLAESLLRAVGWNLANLKDTLARRRVIQAARRVSDRQIQARMMRWPNKFKEFVDFMQNRRTDYWRSFFGKSGPDTLRQSGVRP